MKTTLQTLFILFFLLGLNNIVWSQDTLNTNTVQDTIEQAAPAAAPVAAPAAAVVSEPAPAPKPPKQKKAKRPLKDKLYFGGSITAAFGSYTQIGIYPLFGYKFTPKLSGGLKLGYQYVSDNRYSSTYNTSNFAWSLFTRYRLFPALYLHAEYEMINYELYNELGESTRDWVPFLYLGAGYSHHIGGRAWAYAQVLFDVLQSDKSPYGSWDPFFSVGISVGF